MASAAAEGETKPAIVWTARWADTGSIEEEAVCSSSNSTSIDRGYTWPCIAVDARAVQATTRRGNIPAAHKV